jgi:outer membrane receptor protein involved in Fe transport
MNMQHRSKFATQLMGAAALFSATSFAGQVFAQDGQRRIEEVVVSAERREASIQDTSISITALTGDNLEDFGIRNQEDLQNFIPATTIQPYDSTVRGVGRNFRALGGDPGVATYTQGIYSEDLITATAATFWDVGRIEILRGPQGTLYGRNAVGGAINILYNEPAFEKDFAFKSIVGNFGTKEAYGMFNTPLIDDKLAMRVNFSLRDRDGIVEEIGGPTGDVDGLGTDNGAIQFKWTPTEDLEFNYRQNFLKVDRSFGGANGAGLVVLNEGGEKNRITDALVPGYRFIDTNNTDQANYFQSNFYDSSKPILTFNDPITGAVGQAQRNRAGIDFGDFNGMQNAMASLDGFNSTSAASAALYNSCVFPGDISGGDLCAASDGLNYERIKNNSTQFSASWTVNDRLELVYLYGDTVLSYKRNTDDDNTASKIHDRQFYVNHEADYTSHELQAFFDVTDRITLTSGIFSYDALIDQRGDYYSSLGEARLVNAYEDKTAISPAVSAATGIPAGLSASALAFRGRPMVSLNSAKLSCQVATPAESCQRNNGGNNLQTSAWYGDDGSNPDLNVIHGIQSQASDLLYATQTERDAFAAYSQAAIELNEKFTLTLGIRYAEDKLLAEENLWRYSETGAAPGGFLGLYGGLAQVNITNGGLIKDADGNYTVPTPKATNGGIPFALSVYRPFERTDKKTTGRINLDWDINDSTMMYFSATSGYRSGGYSLVYFSQTPSYDPEELIAYEIGYKSQLFDDTLQLNASAYLYDYSSVHTFTTEVGQLGGTSTSVLAAPGADVMGLEAEALWLATDRLTVGGNFSFTPSEYTESFRVSDTSDSNIPGSLYPGFDTLTQEIKGNQLIQVPESKFTGWASYNVPLNGGDSVEFFSVYSWIDDVYYSPFEDEREMAPSYGRVDARVTWRSGSGNWTVTGFMNNVLDDIGHLQIMRTGEAEFFRHNSTTTAPRMYGLELSYNY